MQHSVDDNPYDHWDGFSRNNDNDAEQPSQNEHAEVQPCNASMLDSTKEFLKVRIFSLN
jgi:hypothetical protein